MKQLKKLGQTATEYLIILAVVIVIALIVVGVMGGIPGVGKGGKQGVDDAYWATAPVGIVSAGISASGTDVIVIKNNKPDTIVVNAIEFDAGNNFVASDITLASGEELRVAPAASVVGCTAGQSFSFDVIINYTVQSTGASYTESGHTYSGTCAN